MLVLTQIQNLWNSQKFRQFTDVRNIGLYIFSIVVLAITWSGVKTVQNNYELQKQISELNQKNTVLKLQNENTKLQNQYFQTDQYLDLSARQSLGLAAPGEKVLIVPKPVATKYVDNSIKPADPSQGGSSNDKRSQAAKNLESWRDFLLGRKLFSN